MDYISGVCGTDSNSVPQLPKHICKGLTTSMWSFMLLAIFSCKETTKKRTNHAKSN